MKMLLHEAPPPTVVLRLSSYLKFACTCVSLLTVTLHVSAAPAGTRKSRAYA
jgi:hypothetical protein